MSSIESRRAQSQEAHDILARLMEELDKMAQAHVQRSQEDYLAYGVGAAGAAPAQGAEFPGGGEKQPAV